MTKAMENGQKRSIEVDVANTNRTFGTILGSEITGISGTSLEDDTYRVQCRGAGGQSFGAFHSPRG